MDGIDALLSTVQMPTGIPVATVAIDGAANAALLAIQMLAISDPELAQKLDESRRAGTEKVLAKNAAIEKKYNFWFDLGPTEVFYGRLFWSGI